MTPKSEAQTNVGKAQKPDASKARKAKQTRSAEAAAGASNGLSQDQERALAWAATYDAPIAMLDGWNPQTGTWAEGSPIAMMLADIRNVGVHLEVAATRHKLRRVAELVSRGRDLVLGLDDSEDRLAIPIETRPLADLALELDHAEADREYRLVARLEAAAVTDARLLLPLLKLRYPLRWGGQYEPVATEEEDPRDIAMREVMQDPNVALQLAEISWLASERVPLLDGKRRRRR